MTITTYTYSRRDVNTKTRDDPGHRSHIQSSAASSDQALPNFESYARLNETSASKPSATCVVRVAFQ